MHTGDGVFPVVTEGLLIAAEGHLLESLCSRRTMEGDGIATLVDVHESEAAGEWRARTELGELRTTREVRGVPVGTVGVAGCHEEHSGRLLEDALQAHGVILVEDEGAPADSVAGCIFGDGVVRHDQGWTVRILHEDAFDVLQLPIGNKTAIGLRPGRVDTENAEFTVVHGPAGLELVFGEDGLNGIEGHGGEHSEAVVVAADHVVVLLVLAEGREDTLQILSFFEFAVVAEVSIDEDVGDAATLHFGEHGGDHDFRPRGGVDGVATLADVDVVGDGYGLDVFASGLGEGGEDTGDFGLVDDVGEPESGFSFLPEGAAFEAVHSVGLEAADGDVVEAGLGVGLVDAAEGLFDVGAREPDLAIGGDTLVGEHMVGVGLFEGAPREGNAGGGDSHNFEVGDGHILSPCCGGCGRDDGVVHGGCGGLWTGQCETRGNP